MSEKTVCKHNYNQCVPCLKKIVKAAKGMSEEAWAGLGEAGPGDPAPGRGRVESGPSPPDSSLTGQSNGTRLGSRGCLQG